VSNFQKKAADMYLRLGIRKPRWRDILIGGGLANVFDTGYTSRCS
jgi:hypothetical protein